MADNSPESNAGANGGSTFTKVNFDAPIEPDNEAMKPPLTDEQIAALLTSYEQMRAIYEGGLKPTPYVIERTRPGQELVLIGVNHSADPEDPQFPVITDEWAKFKNTGDKANKVAMVEGGVGWPVAITADEAISQNGERGLLTYLAHEAGITLMSPEPDRKSEANSLALASSQDDVMLYYFLRQIPQWHREGQNGDVKEYLQDMLGGYKKELEWDIDFTYEHMAAVYRDRIGEELDPLNEQRASGFANPTQDLSSVNETSRASGRYRDLYIAKQMQEQWQAGNSIFAVYGSGHSYTLEPVLAEL